MSTSTTMPPPAFPCPLCSKPMREHDIKAKVPLLRCECGFISIDLRTWKYEYSEKDYYEELQPQAQPKVQDPGVAWIQSRVRAIARHLKSGVVADLGCGAGATVVALAQAGYQAIGVEESKAAMDFCSATFPQARWHQAFIPDYLQRLFQHDALTMYHVLEHIPDPKSVVRLLHGALKPGGLLVIEVPDVGSLQTRIAGGNWHFYFKDHVNYFGLKTLRALFEPMGFELLEVERKYGYSTPLGIWWKDLALKALEAMRINSVIATYWRRI